MIGSSSRPPSGGRPRAAAPVARVAAGRLARPQPSAHAAPPLVDLRCRIARRVDPSRHAGRGRIGRAAPYAGAPTHGRRALPPALFGRLGREPTGPRQAVESPVSFCSLPPITEPRAPAVPPIVIPPPPPAAGGAAASGDAAAGGGGTFEPSAPPPSPVIGRPATREVFGVGKRKHRLEPRVEELDRFLELQIEPKRHRAANVALT